MIVVGCASNKSINSILVEKLLVGSWDEVYEDFCKKPHKISFSNNYQVMNIEYSEIGWVSEEDGRNVFRYSVLGDIPSGLRLRLEEESRLDSNELPVIWHLKIIDEDTYYWEGMIGAKMSVPRQGGDVRSDNASKSGSPPRLATLAFFLGVAAHGAIE